MISSISVQMNHNPCRWDDRAGCRTLFTGNHILWQGTGAASPKKRCNQPFFVFTVKFKFMVMKDAKMRHPSFHMKSGLHFSDGKSLQFRLSAAPHRREAEPQTFSSQKSVNRWMKDAKISILKSCVQKKLNFRVIWTGQPENLLQK